jgi:hypothetical protein
MSRPSTQIGSVAEKCVGPDSDVNLLVVRATTLVGPERGADLAIEVRLDVAYDLVVVTPQEFSERLLYTLPAERF